MKLYVKSGSESISRLYRAERQVRKFIENCFYEGGKNFVDPNMRCNQIYSDWYNSGRDEPWYLYVYNHRDEIFDDYVMDKIVRSNFSEEEKDHMSDYYHSLSSSDYNRLLFLKRDSSPRGVKEMARRLNLDR